MKKIATVLIVFFIMNGVNGVNASAQEKDNQTTKSELEQILDLNPVSKLIYWSSLGRVDCVIAELDAGSDPNSIDVDGYSALQAAAENGHLDIVKLLINHGANVNYKANFTALELARMVHQDQIIQYLKSKGAKE